jgi:hypothetical protein
MTEEVKQLDPLENEILNFSFTVKQTNAILQILGQAPYIASAGLIALVKQQGEPQFGAMLEKEKAKNESKATAEK